MASRLVVYTKELLAVDCDWCGADVHQRCKPKDGLSTTQIRIPAHKLRYIKAGVPFPGDPPKKKKKR